MSLSYDGEPLFRLGKSNFGPEDYSLLIQGALGLPANVIIRAESNIQIARFAELMTKSNGEKIVAEFPSTIYQVPSEEGISYFTCAWKNRSLFWGQGYQTDKIVLWHLIVINGGILAKNLFREPRNSKHLKLWKTSDSQPINWMFNDTDNYGYIQETEFKTAKIPKLSRIEVKNHLNQDMPSVEIMGTEGKLLYNFEETDSLDGFNKITSYGYDIQWRVLGDEIQQVTLYQ